MSRQVGHAVVHDPKQLVVAWLSRTSDRILGMNATTSNCTTPMAHPRSLFAPLSRCTAPFLLSSRSELPRLASTSYQTIRCASKVAPKKKKKARTTFIDHDLKKMDQFALLDAIQYDSIPRQDYATEQVLTEELAIFVHSKSVATQRRSSTKSLCASRQSRTAPSSEIECGSPIQ